MARNIQILQQSRFYRFYKKLHPKEKAAVDLAVEAIVADPMCGEAKRGDLAGVFVYKFLCVGKHYLLAYEFDPRTRILLLVGTHENFYRDLKR